MIAINKVSQNKLSFLEIEDSKASELVPEKVKLVLHVDHQGLVNPEFQRKDKLE